MKAPSAVAVPKVEVTTKYSEDALKSMLSKGGKLPDGFPAYSGEVRQLRELSKKPDLLLKKDGDYVEQVNDFARVIAEVAKRSPLADQDNVCLSLSHKIAQTNRPIENFGRSLYERAIAILQSGGEIKKKVIP